LPPPRPNTETLFEIVNISDPVLEASPSPFKAEVWEQLLSDYNHSNLRWQITKILQHGYRIGYKGPEQLILSKNLKICSINPALISSKIVEDLQLGRLEYTEPVGPLIVSPLGLVPKHDGGIHRIHYLSYPDDMSVNAHIAEELGEMQFVIIDTILQHIRNAGTGAWIMKRGIKDAFRNILVSYEYRWLLALEWEGQYYKETCLPFGLRTALYIFNIFAEAFHWILQYYTDWQTLEHYLDDFILVIPQRKATEAHLKQLAVQYNALILDLGIPQNTSKDICGQVAVILGYKIDPIRQEIRVPQDKLRRIRSLYTNAIASRVSTLRDLQSVIGLLSFCAPAVIFGRLFLRPLWNTVVSYPPGSSPFLKRRLPADARQDLLWWGELLPRFNGTLYYQAERSKIYLFTDTSGIGLGGFWFVGRHKSWREAAINLPKVQIFSMKHTKTVADHQIDISPLEAKAILVALKIWSQIWSGKEVVAFTDNTVTAIGLGKESVKGATYPVIREILLLAVQYNIRIIPKWMQRIDNELADTLSRFRWETVANLCPQIGYIGY
jgi:hypothetical protein